MVKLYKKSLTLLSKEASRYALGLMFGYASFQYKNKGGACIPIPPIGYGRDSLRDWSASVLK